MEPTDKNILFCTQALSKFTGRRGYPAAANIMAMHAKHLCKLVWNESATEILWKQRPDMKEQMSRHSLGDENDLDWLMQWAFEELDHFPEPYELRNKYCEKLTPYDGRKT